MSPPRYSVGILREVKDTNDRSIESNLTGKIDIYNIYISRLSKLYDFIYQGEI